MATVLEVIIRARDQATGVIERASAASAGFSKNIGSAGKAMTTAGSALHRGLTLPIIAAGAAIGVTGARFETSMSRIVGLTNASREQVDAWSKELLELGPVVGKSPRELGDALYFIVGAGIEGSAAIDALTVSAKAAASGLGRTEVIADAVTSAMNAYAKQGMTAARATDVLTAAINFGKLEADQLAPVLGRLLPTASAMGVEFEQVAGILAVFSMTGADAAEGATSLQAILSTLLKPSKEAGEALKTVGLTMADLRKMAAGPDGLIGVFRLLEDRFRGNDEALAQVVPNVRAFRGVMNALAQEGASVDEVLEGVRDSTGSLDKAFGAAKETAEFKFQQSLSKLQGSLIQLSAVVLPMAISALERLTRFGDQLVQKWDQLSPATQRNIVQFAGLAAVLGPALIVTGRLVQAFGILASTMIMVARAVVILNAALVGSPWGLVVLAVTGAIVAYSTFKALTEQTTSSVDRARTAIELLRGSIDELKGAQRGQESATLAVEQANVSVKRAIENRNRVEKEAGKGSAAWVEAQLAVKAAFLHRKQAEEDLADAQKRGTEVERKRGQQLDAFDLQLRTINQTYRDKLIPITAEMREVNRKLHESYNKEVVADYIGKMQELAKTARKENIPSYVAFAEKAIALAKGLGRIPTKKEVGIAVAVNGTPATPVHLSGLGDVLGRALGNGIAAGIRAQGAAAAAAAVSVIARAKAAAIQYARIESPSKTFADEVGKPLGQGVILGWINGTRDLPAKVSDSLRKALERGKTVIENARSTFERAWSRVADPIMRAFDAVTRAHKTPAERRLQEIDDRRRAEDQTRSLADAERALAEAKKEVALERGTDESEADFTARLVQAAEERERAIAEAEVRLARIREDAEITQLEKQAERERLEYEARRESLREQLEQRLETLRTHWQQEGVTADKALQQITGLMRSFGIDFNQAGDLLGSAFADGLRAKIPAAIGAAAAIARAIKEVLEGATPEQAANAAERARKAAEAAASAAMSPARGAAAPHGRGRTNELLAAAHGAVIRRPTVLLAGETAGARPEIISPEQLMRRIVREEGGGGDTSVLAERLDDLIRLTRLQLEATRAGREITLDGKRLNEAIAGTL